MTPWLLPLKTKASGEGQDRAVRMLQAAIRPAKPYAALRFNLRPADTQAAAVVSGRAVAVRFAPVAAANDGRRATP